MAIRFPIAACLWGIAVGMLAYRYGVLGISWSSSAGHVLTGLAIGLAFGGQRLWRDARDGDGDGDAKQPGVPVLVGSGLAGLALAFGILYLALPTVGRAPLAKRELPGFDLSLPKGEIIEDSLDYTAGKLAMKDIGGSRGAVIVQWEPGSPTTPEELKVIAQMLGTVVGDKIQGDAKVTSVPGPDGASVVTVAIEGDGPTFMLSMLRCGIRNVIVGTITDDDAERLHRRIIASFVCRADPAKDAGARVAFPLWLDLPGWYAGSREPDQIMITDGESALTMRTVNTNKELPLEKLLEASFTAVGIDVTLGAREGERIPLTMRENGEEGHGWAQLFPCPRGTALVFGFGSDRAGADALHERVTKSSRCLGAREAPQEWPDAPAEPAAPATP